MVIVDGAAIVNALSPVSDMTFEDYASKQFIPHLSKILCNVPRLDAVFDVYLENYLKNSAWEHHREGSRKCVKKNHKVPTNWISFLHHSQSKTELFSFLAKYGHQHLRLINKTVVFTIRSSILCSLDQDTSNLEPCNHEEADTRIFLHIKDGVEKQSLRHVLIYTVDTDVVVLAIKAAVEWTDLGLFIAFGTGSKFRCINVMKLMKFLGKEKARVFPIFHAFTRCDTVSFFAGRVKRSAMETWLVYKD